MQYSFDHNGIVLSVRHTENNLAIFTVGATSGDAAADAVADYCVHYDCIHWEYESWKHVDGRIFELTLNKGEL